MPRQLFEHFVSPARLRPDLWRLGLGLVLSLLVYVAWIAGLFFAVLAWTGPDSTVGWMQAVVAAVSPVPTLLLLATFAGMAVGPMLAVRLLHRRAPSTLFGPAARALRDFAISATVVGAILAVSVFFWLGRYDPVAGLDAGLWLRLLPLALIGVLVQTGAEEILFRGYLQQQLAARFRSPAMWLVLPALIFGLVHFDPTSAGPNVWIVVAAATVFGLIAADLTARTGSIGASWGFHFANNTVALLVLATQGTMPGLALYLTPYSIDDPQAMRSLALGDVATLGLAWVAVRILVRR